MFGLCSAARPGAAWQHPDTGAHIFVGNLSAARDATLLASHNVRHIVNTTDDLFNELAGQPNAPHYFSLTWAAGVRRQTCSSCLNGLAHSLTTWTPPSKRARVYSCTAWRAHTGQAPRECCCSCTRHPRHVSRSLFAARPPLSLTGRGSPLTIGVRAMPVGRRICHSCCACVEARHRSARREGQPR